MTTVTQMKCACEPCLCIVDISTAVKKNERYYCGDACASGHSEESACSHSGCGCGK